MKSKLQASSILLLIALVLSFVPAATLPVSAAAAQACTDRAQFLADVTVPDGTRFEPGAAFTKTWRLRNTGTCTWTTAYSVYFDSGTQMGATSPSNFANNVAPGQDIEITINMTAPTTAGHYIGYWKFKNAAGVPFGIGVSANRSWWVEINVTGSTQTGVALDFTADAGKATWSSGAGGLTFPGTNGDAKGFALKADRPSFESGVTASQPGLLFSPQQITNGFIQAVYPDFTVQSGDRFQTTVGCEFNATSCYVAYRLDYQVGSTIRTFWTFRERYERLTYSPNLDLSPLAGQTVKFILYVSAWGSPVGDFALWGNPVIVRRGATTPGTATATVTGTPPTASPVTVTVPPSTCDRAQFLADVTVPDGTLMAPGQTFTKTWRLRNVGNCAWTKSYQLVYFSGEKMTGTLSWAFTEDVPVGKAAEFSLTLTAPSAAGSYRGFWMFKNANGQLFGIGSQANKPWWVDIRVSGPTVTPGGVTVTPGGPTVTPAPGIAYDFATRACEATWYSRVGQLPCSTTEDTAKGFVLKVNNPRLETGAADTRPGLLTYPSPPQGTQDGYIQGFFPPFTVQRGDRFRSIVNCESGATLCYAAFRLDYEDGGSIRTLWGPWRERYEPQYYSVDIDLSPLAGRNIKFILTVLSAGVNTGDRALWVGPHIYRAGATSTTPTLPSTGTATPTSTNTGVPTSVTGTATPTSTGAPTGAPTGTPTVTPTITSTPTIMPTGTPTVTPTNSSTTFQNTKYNFRFTLPPGASIVNQSDLASRVSLPLSAAGTNLLSKYLQINVVEGASPCVNPIMENPTSSENVTINNIPFLKQSGQGAGAGNRFDWTAYSTTINNACISLAFVLHSANRGNYATPPTEFDMAKETAVIDTTMATFGKINP